MDKIKRSQAISQGLKKYFTGKPCKRGNHIAPRYVIGRKCVICRRELESEWNQQNPEKLKIRRYRNQRKASQTSGSYLRRVGGKTWVSNLLSYLKRKAKRKGLEFSLSREDIVIPTHCPIFGMKLNTEVGKTTRNRDNSPSVDRIDNSKGYTPDNIQIISYKANRTKNDATIEELELLVNYLKTLRSG